MRGQTLGSGRPLDAGVRRTLEASYHADLGSVRVHTGPSASEAASTVNARAVTAGSHILFARDQYIPHTRAGFERIAHEVAHTLQQRKAGGSGDGSRTYARAEREAGSAAQAAVAGGSAHITARTAGFVQRQETEQVPRYLGSPELQLHLDPEIQAMALRYQIRLWVGSAITEGEPTAEGEGAAAETETTGETPVPPAVPAEEALPPEFFAPYDPGDLGVEGDVGSYLAPYNVRSVPLAGRDVDAARVVFQQNYRFVSLLPDLRAAAPGVIRGLIPSNWRVSMAEAFTAATLNAQLRHDFPTPIEAADLAFYRMTGISTTYIPSPLSFSF